MRRQRLILLLPGVVLVGCMALQEPRRPADVPTGLTREDEVQLAAIADAMTGRRPQDPAPQAPTGPVTPQATPPGRPATTSPEPRPQAEIAEVEKETSKEQPTDGGPTSAGLPRIEAEVIPPAAGVADRPSPVSKAAEKVKPSAAAGPSKPIAGFDRPVTLVASQVPLGLVLQNMVSSQKLNLEFSRGVRAEAPVSVEIHDLPLKQALHTVLDPIGYRFRATEQAVKIVAVETRRVRLSFLNLRRSVTADVGGETLGSIGEAQATATTATAIQTTQFGINRFRGDVSAKFEVKGADVWEEVEHTLEDIMGDEGIFTTNRTSGMVMVTGPPDRVDQAVEFLTAVDRELSKMVHLDVTIIEVRLDDRTRYGINWSGVFHIPGAGRGKDSIVALGESALLSGVVNPLVLTIKARKAEAVIKALGEEGDVRVLSQPKLTVLNGQTALLSVGDIVPFISSIQQTVTENQTLVTPQTATAQEGLVMAVTPSIGEEAVVLQLTPVVNEITNFTTFTVGQNLSFSNPNIANKSLNTMARVRDGEMVVMGGLISRNATRKRTGIPLLKDIPILGLLFSATDDSVENRELVILIRPTIGPVPAPQKMGFREVVSEIQKEEKK